MESLWMGWITALWLGILTSISPCPLASNIAAVSFLSKRISHPGLVFISGLAYTAGRMTAYAVVGWLLIHSLLTIPQTAIFLQKYMGKALGPLLFLTGLVLLEIVALHWPGVQILHQHQSRLAEAGVPGSFLLGIIFALSVCPVSAALFFGSLIPLALKNPAGEVLPFLYGVGTGVPVLAFAVAIALGVTSLSHWFHKLTRIESSMRRVAGVIFLLAGIYYLWSYWQPGGN